LRRGQFDASSKLRRQTDDAPSLRTVRAERSRIRRRKRSFGEECEVDERGKAVREGLGQLIRPFIVPIDCD
jgi:hypothetical protein